MNLPNFRAENYAEHRPLYSPEVFKDLLSELTKQKVKSVRILDLGCGTGAATESFLGALQAGSQLEFEITCLDADAEMLKVAKGRLLNFFEKIQFVLANAEETDLMNESFDVVLIASALHWFHRVEAMKEVTRLVKPNGLALIFEYQFPKSLDCPPLNDWCKGQFNRLWKAPNQTPRGNLKALTQVWSQSSNWRLVRLESPEMILEMNQEKFFGHLLSQSRVLHYLDSLSSSGQNEYVAEIEKEVGIFFGGYPAQKFDYYLSSVLLKRIGCDA